MSKPRVGILTTLYNFDSAYSLCSVIAAQLKALAKYGYAPVLFVHDNFTDDAKVPEGVEIRKIVPRFLLIDYSQNQEPAADLVQQAEKVVISLKEPLADIDIVIEHDILFQGWFLPYAMALHQLPRILPKIKWLHWVHSNPSGRPPNLKDPHLARYVLPANSKIVYLNNHFLIRVAQHFGIFPKDVRIVYNPLDPRLFFKAHPLVESLLDKYPILESDFVQVYPVSTTRMVDGKGLYTLIDIFSKLKQQGKKVCLIIANAHANDKREKQVIAQALSYASQKGLNQTELIFFYLLFKF